MVDIEARTNGSHHQSAGREVPALPAFTFKDTGITVRIRKVSPVLQQEVHRAFPPPKPPMNEVDYGDGKKVKEPNPADPDHQAALVAHTAEMEERMRRLLIKRGVEVDVESIAGDVAQVRADAQEAGITLDPDDKYVYVTYCAVGTWADYAELIDAITRRSMPTEAAIGEALASFRDQVQGT